jgi:hypothetical protein
MSDSLTSVVTCVAGSAGVQGPCPEGSVQFVQSVFLIPASEAGAIQEFLQPFDGAHAAAIFGAAFSVTFGLWFAAWGIGVVVRSVRRF